MRRQLIEDPIELYDLHLNLSSVADELESRVMGGEYSPHTPKRVLVEKSKGLCRQLVVPHPYDCLALECLSSNLHPNLRDQAPHANAFYQPDRGMNSRPKLDYGGRQAWLDFQEKILAFSSSRKVLIVADIANFYDCISFLHLRNILSNYTPENKEAILDLTLHILGALLWQPDYMPRTEVGLPQANLNAPRMLANAFLFELDKYISTTKGADYARYMDDIDVGLDTIKEAKAFLRDIDLVLQTRQLRLNAGKTKILTGRDINWHFRTKQNHFIDIMTDRIEKDPTNIIQHRKLLGRLLTKWTGRGVFDGPGNGEKILKRIVNLAGKISYVIPIPQFEPILNLRPNLREEITRYASISQHGQRYIPSLLRFIRSPDVVDDASALVLAYKLVEMRLPKVVKERKQIADTAIWMLGHERKDVWAYAGLWLLSKFGTQRQLMDAVDKSYPVWQADYYLGRLVASLACMIPRKNQTRYSGLLKASRNMGAAEVVAFYDDIRDDAKTAAGIFRFLRAVNGTPNKISHAKWIVLLHVLDSPAADKKLQTNLKTIHSLALTDRYYRIRARPYLK